jgi:hypothetical protein
MIYRAIAGDLGHQLRHQLDPLAVRERGPAAVDDALDLEADLFELRLGQESRLADDLALEPGADLAEVFVAAALAGALTGWCQDALGRLALFPVLLERGSHILRGPLRLLDPPEQGHELVPPGRTLPARLASWV